MFVKPCLALRNCPTRAICATIAFVVVLIATPCVLAEAPISVEWIQQLGSTETDASESVAVDAFGNIYISGWTFGDFDGETNGGNIDAFLTKYDSSGAKQWTQLIGSTWLDRGTSVAVDTSGNVFISGYTGNDLDGNTNAGQGDAFLIKYDTSGTKLWTRLFGSSQAERSFSVALDNAGNAYIAGHTDLDLTFGEQYDAFLTKYDTSGTQLWTRQLGTSSTDESYSAVVDGSNNIIIAGRTDGGLDGNTNVGGYDAFVAKYDSSGNKLWTQQFGTTVDDDAESVAVDALGNIYISGHTLGGLDGNANYGGEDAYLTKYDDSGTQLWTRQIGSTGDERSYFVTVDALGDIFITGFTTGDLDGNTSNGGYDVFLTKYDPSGVKLWTHQFGTSSDDSGSAVALDGSGNIFISGGTSGDLGDNTNAGNSDVFLVELSPTAVPAPVSFPAGLALLGLIGLRKRRW